jgi:hypothetical protein
MRDVPRLAEVWRSGVYVGDTKPSTRVTVEKGWTLKTTGPMLGTWNRGPARWFQAADTSMQRETEIPGVVSVNMNRSLDADAGSCDIVVSNTVTPEFGAPEQSPGQFGLPGYYTWDHGVAQDARARWGHSTNAWNEVLVPNALLRTYVGFGGQDLPINDAVAQGYLVPYGVWLVDDVTVSSEGTLSLKCRDMGKLLVDQQLFPPLVPTNLYPLDYRRWVYKTVDIPGDPGPPGDYCLPGNYWNSSTDEVYGQWNSPATGHPGTDAFDASPEPGPDVPGAYAHQRSYWLSEPKPGPNDTVWIEFMVNGGNPGLINQVYYHAWKGVIEGRGTHRIMASVLENGAWVSPETDAGGMTPQGLPYVCAFSPGTELAPATATNLYDLPRDYQATVIRLTVTNLLWADDFPYGYADPEDHGGGWRGGARKIMACYSQKLHSSYFPILSFAAPVPSARTRRCRATGSCGWTATSPPITSPTTAQPPTARTSRPASTWSSSNTPPTAGAGGPCPPMAASRSAATPPTKATPTSPATTPTTGTRASRSRSSPAPATIMVMPSNPPTDVCG